MSVLTLDVRNFRHGQIEDGPYWAKVGTLSEEITQNQGFEGQQFIEYPVDVNVSKKIAQELKGIVPGEIQFQTGVRVQGGKPVMMIVGLAQ